MDSERLAMQTYSLGCLFSLYKLGKYHCMELVPSLKRELEQRYGVCPHSVFRSLAVSAGLGGVRTLITDGHTSGSPNFETS